MDAGKRQASAAAPDARTLTLFFTAGVLAVHALPSLASVPLLLLAALMAAVPRSRWRICVLTLVLALALTAARAALWLDTRWPEARHGEQIEIEGRVASLPELSHEAMRREGEPESHTWRFVFEPDAAALPGRIRVAWYRTPEQVRGGDCWRFTLRLRAPRGSLNPGGFDYEGWLFRQGIGATGTVRSAQRCSDDSGYAVLRFRQDLVDRMAGWLDGHAATGLLTALAVGDQSAITDAQWETYRLTGTTHLVAISGLNIAVAAGFAFVLVRWLWSLAPGLCLRLPAQKAGMLGSALMAIAYALLAGFAPPVVRAMLMLLFVLAAAWTHRLSRPSRVLALAWCAILLLDPFAVLSPGLWLSFGAVAAILYFATGRLRPLGLAASLVAVQLLISVALLPLSLYYFHGVSAFAPLVNLVAVPLYSLLTPLLLAAILFASAWPAAGIPLLGFTADVLQLIDSSLLASTSVAARAWIAAGPPLPALALALLGALLLFAPRGLPLRGLALLCFVPLLFPAAPALRGGLEITALDVGQGLAIVVRTPHHALLYDAGPAFDDGFDAGDSVVAPFLLTRGLRRIDALLVSHDDNDHAGGVAAVRRRLRFDREIGTARENGCRAGERWEWDGVRFELLHPDTGNWDGNDGSCVLRIDGPFSALLTGDIEHRAEERLLRDARGSLAADVIVAPHHGSRTSSTPEFVAAVHPQLVIYGAAWRSHYGHPRPQVTQRYAALGARQFVTGNSGALRIAQDDDGRLEVNEWRREAAKFWNAPAEALRAGEAAAGATARPRD